MDKKIRYISAIMLCVYIAAVSFLCFMKPSALPPVELDFFGIPTDKIAHFLMFLPFPVLAYMTFGPSDAGRLRKLVVLLVIIIFGAGMSLATEKIQAMTGYRTEDMKDFLSDMTGIAAGAIVTASYILLKKDRKDSL